ncbi:MAG: hypothetical protein QXD23_02240 [Candidatus Micrarchaeaceae archaeon]
MNITFKNLFFLLFFASFLFINLNFGSTSSLNATVLINCPFYVKLNFSNTYLLSSYLNFSYLIQTTKNCKIPNLSGKIYFWKSNETQNSEFSTTDLNLSNISNISKNYIINVNPEYFSGGNYYGNISLSGKFYPEFSNGPVEFQTILPPSLNFKSINFTNNLNQYSPLVITDTIENNGTLSINKIFYLNLKIITPKNISIKKQYGINPISGQSNLTKILYLYSVSNETGQYSVTQNITYSYSYVLKNITYSFTQNTINYKFNYTVKNLSNVVYPGSSSSVSVIKITSRPLPPSVISNVSYISTPELVTLNVNQSYIYNLNFFNNFNDPVWINMSTINVTGINLSLSSKDIYLLPYQSISVSLTLFTSKYAKLGTNIIPIKESITDSNHVPINYTQFILGIVSNTKNSSLIVNNILSLNNSKDIEGTIEVKNIHNYSISNSTVTLTLPAIITDNINNIILSGSLSNVIYTNNSYLLSWDIPYMNSGMKSYLYYYIKNVSNILSSEVPSIAFSIPQNVLPNSNLNLYNTEIPTIYTNQINNINFTLIYNGTIPNNITAILSAPKGISISNAEQHFNVLPNTVFSPNFNISTDNNSGTYILKLYFYSNNINKNYTFNMIVLPKLKIQEINEIQNTTSLNSIKVSNYIIYYIYGVIGALLIITIIIINHKSIKKSKYNENRAKKLKELNEQIKRGE